MLSGIEALAGSAFTDTLTGDAGSTPCRAARATTRWRGGAGADALNGGDGSDRADYLASAAGAVVDLSTNVNTGGDAAGDVLTGIETVGGSAFADSLTGDGGANKLWGRDGDDTLAGAGGNDTLYGEAGTDTLNGGDGADILVGGAGADGLNGGAGTDTAHYGDATAGVTLSLLAGTGTGGDAAGDNFTSIKNVIGSAFNDTLTSNAGANAMWGMAGADVLVGGGGADALKGGTGADTFVYTAISDSTVAGAGRNSINDFSHADGDRIDLGAIDADGNAANGNTAFTFISGGPSPAPGTSCGWCSSAAAKWSRPTSTATRWRTWRSPSPPPPPCSPATSCCSGKGPGA